MQYAKIQTADGPRRLVIPNEVVEAGGKAVDAYIARPPKDAVYEEAPAFPPIKKRKQADETTNTTPAPVATETKV